MTTQETCGTIELRSEMSHRTIEVDFLTSRGWEFNPSSGFLRDGLEKPISLSQALNVEFEEHPESVEDFKLIDSMDNHTAQLYEQFMDS